MAASSESANERENGHPSEDEGTASDLSGPKSEGPYEQGDASEDGHSADQTGNDPINDGWLPNGPLFVPNVRQFYSIRRHAFPQKSPLIVITLQSLARLGRIFQKPPCESI